MDCPDIYQFDDYRTFLKSVYQQRCEKFTRYSYKRFSADLGLPATSMMSLVLSRRRKLSLKALEKIIEAFGWRSQQKKYFRALVHYNDAPESKREQYKKEIEKILGRREKKLHPDEYAFFSNWYIPVIRELVAFRQFVPNFNWIARTLTPKIEERLAQKGMEILERLNLIKKEKKRWNQTEAHITTDPQTQSGLVRNYHAETLKLAMRSLDLPSDQRENPSMVIGLSDRQFQKLRKRVVDFLYEIQQEVQDETDQPTMVAQLSLQLFPTAQLKKNIKTK